MNAPVKPAPCPFCGATHEQLRSVEVAAGNWAVCCDVCEGIGPTDTDPLRASQLWGGAARRALERRTATLDEQILAEVREIRRLAAARRGGDLRDIERLAAALVARIENREVLCS